VAAPAAPVVVEGGALAALTGALILAVLVWATLFCLQQFYTYTFGALLHGLAGALDKVPFLDLGDRTVGKVNDFVQAQIGHALSGAETSVGRTWHALSYVARLTASTVELLAHSTLDAIHALARSAIPELVNVTVVPSLARLSSSVASLRSTVAGIRRDLYARVGELERDIGRVYGRAHAEVGDLRAHALPALWGEVNGLERGLGDLRGYTHRILTHRVGRLEARLAGAAITAAAIAALTRVAPWARCSNVGKLGRAVCRTEHNFLDSLLAGSLLIVGTISLAQMARELREPTGLVMGGIEGFVRELRELS